MDGIFQQFCTFRNVCYKDNTLYYSGDPPYNIEVPLKIYSGVGRLRRNNSPIMAVDFVDSAEFQDIWYKGQNEYIDTKSFLFSQTFNNYYFTLYSLFGLHETFKVVLPQYPTSDYRHFVRLFLADDNLVKPLLPELYSIYSSSPVQKISHMDKGKSKKICFDDITVGLERNAILGEEFWYENLLGQNTDKSGSFKPTKDWRSYYSTYKSLSDRQRRVDDKKVFHYKNSVFYLENERVRRIFTEFRDFSLDRLGLTNVTSTTDKIVITFIVRSTKRKIVNLEELEETITSRWRDYVHVQMVNLEDHNLSDQIRIMRNTSILVGMHGAGIMNAMWLRDNSEVIEMFPFKYYKPTYELVCELLSIKRHVWVNDNADDSIFDWSRINVDLTYEEKERIINSTRLKKVKDGDLKNLFKNQDTYINAGKFMSIINPIISKMVLLRNK